MSDHRQHSNRDQQRAARKLAREQGLGYQKALALVRGQLPALPDCPSGLPLEGPVWQRRKLSLVQAKSGSGKTTALCNIAAAAAGSGRRVLFVELQMTQGLVAARLAPLASPEALERIEIFDNVPADGERGQRFGLERLRELITEHQPELVLLDPLEIMDGAGSRQQCLDLIGDLRALARRSGIALVAANSLSKTELPGLAPSAASHESLAAEFVLQLWMPAYARGLEPEEQDELRDDLELRLLVPRRAPQYGWGRIERPAFRIVESARKQSPDVLCDEDIERAWVLVTRETATPEQAIEALERVAAAEWSLCFLPDRDGGQTFCPEELRRQWFKPLGSDPDSLEPCEENDPQRNSEWWVVYPLPEFESFS